MKEQSTFKGFAILSAATIAVKVLSLIYNPFLVKILGGDRPFAIYNVTYQIYVFIYVITNTGIPSAISKLVSEYAAVKNYKAAVKTFKIARTVMIIVSIVTSLFMFITAGVLTNAMKYPEAELSVIALCPAIFFTSVASVYRGYFQGRGNMKPTAVSQVIEQILNTVFSLLFAAVLIKKNIVLGCVGATVGTTLGALSSAAYLYITYRNNRYFRINKLEMEKETTRYSSKQILRKIIKYSVPITICIAVTNAGTLIDTTNTTNRLLAAGFKLMDAQALTGTLGKYTTLINVPITIISALAVTVLPAVSKAVALKDRNLANRKINFGFRLCFMVAIPSAVGLSVLSKPIFKLLYPSYLNGYKLLMYGSIVLVFMALVQIQTSILQGLGRLYVVTFYSVLGIAVKLIVNYICIAQPGLNINGAIIGSVAGFLVPLFLNAKYIKENLKFKINMKKIFMKPIVSSFFMGIIIYCVYYFLNFVIGFITKGYINNALAVTASVTAGVLAYGFAMLYLRGITSEELSILPVRVRKIIPQKLL